MSPTYTRRSKKPPVPTLGTGELSTKLMASAGQRGPRPKPRERKGWETIQPLRSCEAVTIKTKAVKADVGMLGAHSKKPDGLGRAFCVGKIITAN